MDDLNVCIDEEYAELEELTKLKEEGYQLLHKINSYTAYLKKRKEADKES